MGSPTSYSIREERRYILDELEDLPLKGFQEIDNTPTTVVTSLPTPRAALPGFAEGFAVVSEGIHDVIPPSDSFVQIVGQAPSAPLLKDLDTFTEGTGKGSFDSIPAASTDEYGEPIPRINTLSLALLPPHDTLLSIEIWREEVFTHSPTVAELAAYPSGEEHNECHDSSSPHKRPRSLASDDDDRRIRRRAQSDISLAASSPVFLMDGRQHLPMVDTPHDNRHQLRRSHSVPPD